MFKIILKNFLKLFINLKISIFLLVTIIFLSSIGSIIEQNQSLNFYKVNYPNYKFFLNSNLIFFFGLNHVYTSWFFLTLILLFSFSLFFCTLYRQFPIVNISKGYIFKNNSNSFLKLPFCLKFPNIYYIFEKINLKFQSYGYFFYQKRSFVYGYKGLIGRLSPILVHISLLCILFGSLMGAFKNYNCQEILPENEISHLQNSLFLGLYAFFPKISIRINDFWIEYEKNIRQFYSNISILNNFGMEVFEKTISVNIPLKFKGVSIYQSDWNLIAFRYENIINKLDNLNQIFLYPIKFGSKIWVTFIGKNFFIIDSYDDKYFFYSENLKLLGSQTFYDNFNETILLINLLSTTGILVKRDLSLPIVYLGFFGLILTTFCSYIPYTQIWIILKKNKLCIGSLTNRGKISLEVEWKRLKKYLSSEFNNFLNILN